VKGRAVLAAPLLTAAVAVAGGEPRIDPFEARRDGDRVAVSFHVEGAVLGDALDHLQSGLRIEQRHRVEVLGRRPVPLWPAKTLARLRIDTSATFDTLTRHYELSRVIQRAARGERWETLREERHRTLSLDEVRTWMSEFTGLPELELPEEVRQARVRLRIESTLGRRFVLYLFPGSLTVSAELRLEP
jgi:hypothetical protein